MNKRLAAEEEKRVSNIISDVIKELESAVFEFPRFRSDHEAYAVILEELDELWDAIKRNEDYDSRRKEAIQVAAMAIRYVSDRLDLWNSE